MAIKALPDESKALLILLASAFLFSLMGTFMKLSSRDIPSTQLIFYRATFQGILVLIGMIFIVEDGGIHTTGNRTANATRTRLIQHPLGRSHHRSVVLARGIVGGFAFLNYFYALKVLPMGDAVTLFSLYPIITVFSARIFLGEEILWSHLLAALCSLLGAFLIAGPNLQNTSHSVSGSGSGNGIDSGSDDGDNRLGYIAAIMGSFGGSAVLVLTRHAGIAVHTFQLIFSWAIFSILFSFSFGHSPIGIGIEEPWHMPGSSETWKYISAMMVFGSMAHFMMNYAARLAPAGLGAIVRSSDIMWAYLWQVVIFDQMPTANTIVGVVLVSMSLILTAVTKMRKEMKVLGTSSENTNAMMGDNFGAVDELTPILGRSGTLSGGDGVA